MAELKIYPKLPTAPEYSSEQEKFNTSTVNSQLEELIKLKNKFNTKYEKYNKALHRLVLLNAGTGTLTIASGIGSIVTGATLIGIPVSVGLGGVALSGSISTGIITALIKKYQNKLNKVMKLYDVVTSAIAVFENSFSRALNDDNISHMEFQTLCGIYYEALQKMTKTDRKMESETRNQFEKSLMAEVQSLKKTLNQEQS